jgi:hypothetical protein
MKKTFGLVLTLALVAVFATSCKSGKWSDAEKSAFVDNCIPGASENPDIDAEGYCNCMLDKVMDKYPSAADVEDMSISEMMEMAEGCIGG